LVLSVEAVDVSQLCFWRGFLLANQFWISQVGRGKAAAGDVSCHEENLICRQRSKMGFVAGCWVKGRVVGWFPVGDVSGKSRMGQSHNLLRGQGGQESKISPVSAIFLIRSILATLIILESTVVHVSNTIFSDRAAFRIPITAEKRRENNILETRSNTEFRPAINPMQ
jgi:hypothetical protein